MLRNRLPFVLTLPAALALSACQSAAPAPRADIQDRDAAIAMPPGPYASVEAVPVPELAAFTPALPQKLALPNGITVLLMPDRTRPLVELTLALHAGSFQDPPGRTGLAGIMAEVMRDGGSEAWPGDRLDEELAFRGAEIELRVDDERTSASLTCLTEDFDDVLGMFTEVVQQPAFPQDKLDTELDAMRAEILQRNDNPGRAASREAQRAFYGVGDPRARRMELSDLADLRPDELAALHADLFGSRGAILSVYGDFEPADMRAKLEAAFGAWPEQPGALIAIPTEVPRPEARRVVLAARDDVNQAELRLVQEGVRLDDPDYPALRLGSFVFGAGGFSSRMIARIRTELGLAYTTGAFWQPSMAREGLFWGWCGTKNQTCGLALREMLGLLQGFVDEGVSVEELESARQRLLNAEVFRLDTPSEVLERVAELEFQGYPWDFDANVIDAVRGLSASDVVEACRRHLDPARLTVFVMGDPARFDQDLAAFGPVEEWSLEAPDPATALLEAHGGVAAWQGVAALARSVARPAHPEEKAEVLLVHPDRMRVSLDEGGPPAALVLAGERSWWEQADRPPARLAPEEEADSRSDLHAALTRVLMALSRGECEVVVSRPRALVVAEAGRELTLELGDGGLVSAIVSESDGSPLRVEYRDYRERAGLMLPGVRVVETGSGADLQWLEDWQVNPAVSADWFDPAGRR